MTVDTLDIPGFTDVHLLATGSMGNIFRGIEIETGALRAIKVVHPDLIDNKWVNTCLRNEFEFARKFEGANLVRAYQWYKEGPGFSMDHVDGVELKALLHEGEIALKDKIAMALGVCDALNTLHHDDRGGILHLDIKPENVLVRRLPEGEVLKRSHIVLLDYGTAQLATRNRLSFKAIKEWLSNRKIVGGSFLYMSPEQTRVGDLDERSDIYSVGCLHYELFSGEPPFVPSYRRKQGQFIAIDEDSVDRQELSAMHQRELPRNPREINPSIPEPLAGTILKCLEKMPKKRFNTAFELASEIQQVRQGLSL